jgi:hypothetical protein
VHRHFVICLLFAVRGAAQEPTFSARVSMVEIDAQVIGKTGVIEGLQLQDFIVKDQRQPVPLRYCLREVTPLDLILLFEVSKLMAPKLAQMQTAAEMAMAELREGDRVAVMSFNERVQPELPLTGDLREVRRRIRIGLENAAFGPGLPSLLAVADAAAKYFSAQTRPHQRRAALMFTSDIDNGMKQENHMAVAKPFWENDAFLSAFVIPNRLTRFTHDDNPLHFRDLQLLGSVMKFSAFDSIEDIAWQTGGEVVYAADTGYARAAPNPSAALRQTIQRMRRRYKLYYNRPPGKPGQRRLIEVALSQTAAAHYPDARIVSRQGYVVPKREILPQ